MMQKLFSHSTLWRLQASMLATVVCCVATWTTDALAVCMWEPPDTIAVLPADGATGVPTDALLWLHAGMAYDREWSVELEGTPLQDPVQIEGRWLRYAPGPLPPNTDVSWTVSLCPTSGDCSRAEDRRSYGPFNFRTGTSEAAPPVPPPVPALSFKAYQGPQGYEEGTCSHIVESHDCFDGGPLVMVSATTPTAAEVIRVSSKSRTFILPGACPAQALVGCWVSTENACPVEVRPSGVCLTIQGGTLSGAWSDATTVCDEAPDAESDVGISDAAPLAEPEPPTSGEANGCSAAGGSTSLLLVALGLLVGYSREKCA